MRLFIGIPLDKENQERIVDSLQDIRQNKEMRFGVPENYHVTLQFLGETTIPHSALYDLLLPVVRDVSPFQFSTDQLVGFPRNQKATSVGFSVIPKNPFLDIRDKIQVVLQKVGFSTDKSLEPHITIARMKHPINTLPLQKSFKGCIIHQQVLHIVIFRSILQSAGPIYHQLDVLSLKGEQDG